MKLMEVNFRSKPPKTYLHYILRYMNQSNLDVIQGAGRHCSAVPMNTTGATSELQAMWRSATQFLFHVCVTPVLEGCSCWSENNQDMGSSYIVLNYLLITDQWCEEDHGTGNFRKGCRFMLLIIFFKKWLFVFSTSAIKILISDFSMFMWRCSSKSAKIILFPFQRFPFQEDDADTQKKACCTFLSGGLELISI